MNISYDPRNNMYKVYDGLRKSPECAEQVRRRQCRVPSYKVGF